MFDNNEQGGMRAHLLTSFLKSTPVVHFFSSQLRYTSLEGALHIFTGLIFKGYFLMAPTIFSHIYF